MEKEGERGKEGKMEKKRSEREKKREIGFSGRGENKENK